MRFRGRMFQRVSRTDLIKGKNSSLTKIYGQDRRRSRVSMFLQLSMLCGLLWKGKKIFFSCILPVNCNSYRIGREKSQRTICSFSVENRILWTVEMMIIVLKHVELQKPSVKQQLDLQPLLFHWFSGSLEISAVRGHCGTKHVV